MKMSPPTAADAQKLGGRGGGVGATGGGVRGLAGGGAQVDYAVMNDLPQLLYY